MVTFEELLNRLVALGGIATNIELRNGKNGRGVFPKNPKNNIELKIPKKLLAPVEWIGLSQDGDIFLNEKCTWNEFEKEFFYDYQRFYGWNSVKNEINSHLIEFGKLPVKAKDILIKLSAKNKIYSGSYSINDCFEYYLSSRRVRIENKFYLMPIFELLNHDIDALSKWIHKDSVNIKGNFEEEITINYSDRYDALDLFTSYGFAENPKHVLSGFLSIRLLSNKTIHIGRFPNDFELKAGQILPKIIEDDYGIKITFLELYNAMDEKLPLELFSKLMLGKGISEQKSQILFEGIKSENRKLYIQLLMELQEYQGNVVNCIKKMAYYQLMCLA